MIVAERLRRNRKITRTTSASVRNSVNCTSASEARIDTERSERSCRSTDAGSCCLRFSITARTRPATATVLVPGCRWIASTIARLLRSEEHTSELQSRLHLVCRLLLEKKKKRAALGGA